LVFAIAVSLPKAEPSCREEQRPLYQVFNRANTPALYEEPFPGFFLWNFTMLDYLAVDEGWYLMHVYPQNANDSLTWILGLKFETVEVCD